MFDTRRYSVKSKVPKVNQWQKVVEERMILIVEKKSVYLTCKFVLGKFENADPWKASCQICCSTYG